MIVALIFVFLLPSALAAVVVNPISSGQVIVRPSNGLGYYIINNTITFTSLTVNATYATFTGLDANNNTAYVLDNRGNKGAVLCTGSSTCSLNATSSIYNIIFAPPPGTLIVTLVTPDPTLTTNVIQNNTFTINATVSCIGGICDKVYGTPFYNLTSNFPDTSINTTQGDKPFYIQESPYPSNATKACPTNPLTQNVFCNITWTVNATGAINTNWKIGVLFNSSIPTVSQNATNNATVSIICIIDITTFNSINFGAPNPNTSNNSATGNNNGYNITVNPRSCPVDLYTKGTDLINSTDTNAINTPIGVGNMTFNNVTNNNATAWILKSSYQSIKLNANPSNVTTWYWLTVPPVWAATYAGNVTIEAVSNGSPP